MQRKIIYLYIYIYIYIYITQHSKENHNGLTSFKCNYNCPQCNFVQKNWFSRMET